MGYAKKLVRDSPGDSLSSFSNDVAPWLRGPFPREGREGLRGEECVCVNASAVLRRAALLRVWLATVLEEARQSNLPREQRGLARGLRFRAFRESQRGKQPCAVDLEGCGSERSERASGVKPCAVDLEGCGSERSERASGVSNPARSTSRVAVPSVQREPAG
jgi:hypothetical protein